jgi:hypothetical protein
MCPPTAELGWKEWEGMRMSVMLLMSGCGEASGPGS